MITSVGKVKSSTGIRLAPDQVEEIERISDASRLAKTAVMRQLIDEALNARKERSGAPGPFLLPPSADVARDWHYTEMPISGVASAGLDRHPALVDSDETARIVNPAARKAQKAGWKVVRVVGDSMEPTFFNGDLVLVEPSSDMSMVKPKEVVYCLLNGEPQIKEWRDAKGRKTLMPHNLEDHSPIPITEEDDLVLLGIVHDLVQRERANGKR